MPKDFYIFPYSFSVFARSAAGQMPQVERQTDRQTNRPTGREHRQKRAEANYKMADARAMASPVCRLVCLTYAYKYLLSYFSLIPCIFFFCIPPPRLLRQLQPHLFNLNLSLFLWWLHSLGRPPLTGRCGHTDRRTQRQFINVGDGKAFCFLRKDEKLHGRVQWQPFAIRIASTFPVFGNAFPFPLAPAKLLQAANSGANKFQFD